MQYSIGTIVLGLIALIYLIQGTYANNCTTNADCENGATTCAGSATIKCFHHPNDGVVVGAGVCTCTAGTCVHKEECYEANRPDLDCPDEIRHCYDSHCVCGSILP